MVFGNIDRKLVEQELSDTSENESQGFKTMNLASCEISQEMAGLHNTESSSLENTTLVYHQEISAFGMENSYSASQQREHYCSMSESVFYD